MKILFLPYCKVPEMSIIAKTIQDDSMHVFVENTKRKNEGATFDYSYNHDKFIFTVESEITLEDLKKENFHNWNEIGNGISRGTINDKKCTWIVCHKDADLSDNNIKKIIQILKDCEKHG